MTAKEVAKMVEDAVEKAVKPITEQVDAIVKAEGETTQTKDKKKKDDENVTAEEVAKMVGDAVEKAVKPITDTLAPLMKSRALPGNLNDEGDDEPIEKGEQHYLHGIL